jgi:hypothetical protein
MAEDRKSISLGLSSGGATTLKLEQADIDKLIAAIQAGDTWVEVNDEKRTVTLRSDHVEFYALDPEEKDERRAGF